MNVTFSGMRRPPVRGAQILRPRALHRCNTNEEEHTMKHSMLVAALTTWLCACDGTTGPRTFELIKNGEYEGQSMAHWSVENCAVGPGGVTPTSSESLNGDSSLEFTGAACTIKTSSALEDHLSTYELTISALSSEGYSLGVKVFWFGPGGLGKRGVTEHPLTPADSEDWVQHVYPGEVPVGAGGMRLEVTAHTTPGRSLFLDGLSMVAQ